MWRLLGLGRAERLDGQAIGFRLVGSFALALVVLALAGGAAVWQLRHDDSARIRALQGESRALTLVLEMRATHLKAHTEQKNVWLRGADPVDYQSYVDKFESRVAHLRELRAEMDGLTPYLDDHERALLARFDATYPVYLDAWQRALVAYGGPTVHDTAAADALMAHKDSAFEPALDDLAASLQEHRRADSREAMAAGRDAAVRVGGLLGLTTVLGLVVALVAVRATNRTLRQRTAVAEAAKFRALGQLAGGVAHDVNQSLGIIAGYGELAFNALSQPIPDLARAREGLELVTRAAMDAGETVARLLRYTRSAPDGPSSRVEVGDLLSEVAKLTAPRWRDEAQAEGRQITVEVATTGDTAVLGWPPRLREALTNLVLNAVDALPEGGTIRLAARRVDDEVVVAVADTGTGMPEEVRAHLFEPFFTTKGERGTGLGLAMVFGIVEQHGGRIEVTSQPGRGTTFTIRMAAAPAEAAGPVAVPVAPGFRPLRVLAVDDEPALARMVVLMMKQQGHQAEVATSGEQALAQLGAAPFDVVVSDLGMGKGMTGWELVDEVRRRWPRVRFVLATGWGADIDPAEARRRGVDAVIAKPYRVADLQRVAVGV